MSARPIAVTVLSPEGKPLGTWTSTPTNGLWRAKRQTPHLLLAGTVRPCERLGDGWALRLREGERAPSNNARTRG
ncbi:hypothetical protein GCM10012319_32060 [Comamonas sp. KCTC 72670]|nr:hypothetical protein GCM10012319_32060 [Comamonas sp. KCTC 72670]